MSVATFTTPTASATPRPAGSNGLTEKVSVRNLDFFYGDNRALKSVSCRSTRAR